MTRAYVRAIVSPALIVLGILGSPAGAQSPSVADALLLKPLQSKDVEIDVPTTAQQAKCSIKSEAVGKQSGWIVRDDGGRLLRRFLDTNGDNKVDRWCYYKDGIEVYRDIDVDFNGKADQYRWLGTAGTRWAVDRDEDGKPDYWKAISAEEVSAEVVAALRDRDADRFARVLLTTNELAGLGLGKDQKEQVGKKVEAAKAGFPNLAGRQKVVTSRTIWEHFGATRPGLIPAGTDGNTKDLVVYENVAAVVRNGEKHAQIVIGTLVKVGSSWRVIDAPQRLGEGRAGNAGFFFQASMSRVPDSTPADSGIGRAAQELMSALESVDKQLNTASQPAKIAELNAQRADVLEKLAAQAVQPKNRSIWVRQYADTLQAAVQAGHYAAGVGRLRKLHDDVGKDTKSPDIAYVRFRFMTAEYGDSLQKPDANYAQVQEKWLKQLEGFVKDFPQAEDAAEVMLQLAIAKEFAGEIADARKWYGRIVSDFPKAQMVQKASGAKRRLESVGKLLALRGQTSDGRQFDVSAHRGRVVLIHYWATWCEPCKKDMVTIKQMHAKYAGRGFSPIGINVDSDKKQMQDFLRQNRLSWTQLHEAGGLDGRLANELGVLTLPTMLLIDKQGRVVNRSVHAAELDAELQKVLGSR